MKVTTTLRLAALLGVVAFAGTAQAQSCLATNLTNAVGRTASAATPNCDVNNTASATVQHVLRLTLGSTTTSLGTIGETAFDSTAAAVDENGWPWALGPTLSAKGNRPYNVYIRAGAAAWTFVAGGTFTGTSVTTDPNKPSSDLAVLLAPSGTVAAQSTGFAALSTTDVAFITQAAGSVQNRQIQYRAAWNYATDVPGTYSIPVVYTIVGQ